MTRAVLAAGVAVAGLSLAHAQGDVLIEIERGRTEGLFTKTPVVQRAILAQPLKPTDTALLVFRGAPGYGRIQSTAERHRNLPTFIRLNQRVFLQNGIALVIVDCPTDQWGEPGPYPTSCFDGYRSSQEHAEDVRSVIAWLRKERGYAKFYVIGHSAGTVSSRWLAKNLGGELSGAIHSASINVPNPRGYASSMPGFDYAGIATPVLHVHHENDACRGTPYSTVRDYAGENLVTVRGGTPEGDPCGGGHLHSYQGREEAVARAVVSWIRTRTVERVVGE